MNIVPLIDSLTDKLNHSALKSSTFYNFAQKFCIFMLVYDKVLHFCYKPYRLFNISCENRVLAA